MFLLLSFIYCQIFQFIFLVLDRGQDLVVEPASVASSNGDTPPVVCADSSAVVGASSTGDSTRSGLSPGAAPSSHHSSTHLDYRVIVSPDGERAAQPKRVATGATPIDRGALKRRSTGFVGDLVHRVSVDFNIIRCEGEVDDERDYYCPHCGCELHGSLLMRQHLSDRHQQIRR